MNDKQKAQLELVREAYAERLFKQESQGWSWNGNWEELNESWHKSYRDKAGNLLNLKDSKGYLVEIADPEQGDACWLAISHHEVCPRQDFKKFILRE